jgi:hypothetical protein
MILFMSDDTRLDTSQGQALILLSRFIESLNLYHNIKQLSALNV